MFVHMCVSGVFVCVVLVWLVLCGVVWRCLGLFDVMGGVVMLSCVGCC